jgi:endo-1,4-beta-xylanase
MRSTVAALGRAMTTNKTFGWVLVAIIVALPFSLLIYFIAGRPTAQKSGASASSDLLTAGWSYMPGVVATANGLHISYIGRSIVRQDGTPGQDNPAVNVYGTHIQGAGDTTLRATLQDINGAAHFRLYGDVPVVQDEFRIEPDSIDIKIEGTTAVISRWKAYTKGSVYEQAPADSYRASFAPADATEVQIKRQATTIAVSINNKAVATLRDIGSLSRSLWFGLSATQPSDTWRLTQLKADMAQGVTVVNSQDTPNYAQSSDGLQEMARIKRPGFLVGAAVAPGPLVADTSYGTIALGGNFGQLTPENVLKWQFIHPQPTVYDFQEADAIVDIAQKNKLAVHGHALVFGEANSAWVTQLPISSTADKTHIEQIMIDHINQTMRHFKGKILSWDVVNEPLADYDTPAGVDGLRQHIWYKALGEQYIATAFTAARQADPQAKLFINEFGIEADDARWQTFLQLVTKLKMQGVPIDGVGFQAHVYGAGDEISPSVLRSHIQDLAKLGLVSRISEMDVYDDKGVAAQAAQFANVFAACLAEPSCVSWSTWGVTDRYDMSLDDANTMQTGSDFLWDASGRPTPGVMAIRHEINP